MVKIIAATPSVPVQNLSELLDTEGKFFVVRWWSAHQGSLNDVFLKQLVSDWQSAIANEAVNVLILHYGMKKYV